MVSPSAQLPSIIIRVSNDEPVPVKDYSDLLAALAKDYSKGNKKGTLVITRIEEGSIIATLQDALACTMPHVKDATAVLSAMNSLKALYASIQKVLTKSEQPMLARSC